MIMSTLDELARIYGTDKADHGYTHIYPHYFKKLRARPVTLVELGVLSGASLRMWADYFTHPDTCIFGIDNEISKLDSQFPRTSRVAVCQRDQTEPIEWVHPDIVIDDASHLSHLTIASFKAWWPLLKPDGIYVIEDLHPVYTQSSGLTTMDFLKSLADEVNGEVAHLPPEHRLGYDLTYIHFWPDLAIIKKRGQE